MADKLMDKLDPEIYGQIPGQSDFNVSQEMIDEFNELIDDLARIAVLHMEEPTPTDDVGVGVKRMLWPILRTGDSGYKFQDRIYSIFRKCTKEALEERMAKEPT